MIRPICNALPQSMYPHDADGLHIATLLCALFVLWLGSWTWYVYAAQVDVGKDVYYALDEAKQGILDRIIENRGKARAAQRAW